MAGITFYTYIKSVSPPKGIYSQGVNTLKSVSEVFTLTDNFAIYGGYNFAKAKIKIIKPNGDTAETFTQDNPYSSSSDTQNYRNYRFPSVAVNFDTIGDWKVIYAVWATNESYNNASGQPLKATFTFSVIEQKRALAKWNIASMLDRVISVCEPLRAGEESRFFIDEEQNKIFKNIEAPEMSFSKSTLREVLQEIGKVVHGEPRLTPQKVNGKWKYRISYDLFTKPVKGTFIRQGLAEYASEYLDNYATDLDSNAENLVSQLDSDSGTIAEPYAGGFKSVRGNSSYAMLEESDLEFETQFNFYDSKTMQYEDNAIGAYLVEKADYETMSSYSEAYPYARCYAMYYEKGQKNVKGLFFKVDKSKYSAYKNYAIINILRQAKGDSGYTNNNYQDMSFNIEYTPIYSGRISQSKMYVGGNQLKTTQIINQSANLIETRYYGEMLKGNIAKMGNVEIKRSYRVPKQYMIPKTGQLYNKDYYVSSVVVEILPIGFNLTVGLTKDFNKLSQYIGISSDKRLSEVSQDEAYNRDLLYREYIVLGDKSGSDSNTILGDEAKQGIAKVFTTGSTDYRVNNVFIHGETYSDNDLSYFLLPVISSAFGNSVSFRAEFKNNYSAGSIVHKDSDNSAWYQDESAYGDFYGRLYYLCFYFQTQGRGKDYDWSSGKYLTFPKVDSDYLVQPNFMSCQHMVVRKDSKERLAVNFQVDFVSNREDLIIGSGIAKCSPLVSKASAGSSWNEYKTVLYILPRKISKFASNVVDLGLSDEEMSSILLNGGAMRHEVYCSSFDSGITISNNNKFYNSGESWVIAKQLVKTTTTDSEDEKGNIVVEKEYKGGEILLLCNTAFNKGDEFKTIYLNAKREVFNTDCWTDKR